VFHSLGHNGYDARSGHLLFACDDCVRFSGRTEVLLVEDKQEDDQTRTVSEVQS
jgi:hypothetical protein